MKIKLVAFQDNGLPNIGMGRVSSYIKSQFSDVETYFYSFSGRNVRLADYFRSPKQETIVLNHDFIVRLAKADIIGVSCVSSAAHVASTIEFLAQIKLINPACFTVWGGVHATMNPESCIKHAEAVCIGEGEKGLAEVIRALHETPREHLTTIKGFWFKQGDTIIRNTPRPLLTSEELDEMPFQDFGPELFFADNKTIHPIDAKSFLSSGTTYSTMWSMGCPFNCIYCGNSRQLALNRNYGRIRYPRPEHIIREIKEAVEKYDYLLNVELVDDNFFFIKEEDIIEFARLYKQQIGLPLSIPGIYPGVIKNEKLLDILIDAGLRKVRIGIQSGSERMLKFLNRKTSKKAIVDSANLLISKCPKLTPPFVDIIMDIPGEDEQDIQETIELLDSLKRPFFLNLYSLRVIPGTELSTYAAQHPECNFVSIEQSAGDIFNIRYGTMLYLVTLGKWPRPVKALVNFLGGVPMINVAVYNSLKMLFFIKRSFSEIKRGNLRPLMVFFPNLINYLYEHKRLKQYKINSSASNP